MQLKADVSRLCAQKVKYKVTQGEIAQVNVGEIDSQFV